MGADRLNVGRCGALRAAVLALTLPAAIAASGAVYGQTDPERIDRLEQEVARLGARVAARPIEDEGLPLHGFMDVGAHAANNGGLKGFNLGNLDFYLVPRIGERIKGLVELNFEVSDEGELGTDLERMQIAYVFGDALTVWAGRFHSPWGYWNTAFHHGQQIQTSITRPRFLDFEDRGGILPVHSVGVWASGAMRSGDGRVTYDFYVNNSQRIALDTGAPGSGVLDPNLGSATNHNAATGFNVGYVFPGVIGEGLRLGVHGYTARIDDDAAPANSTQLRFYGPYGVYLDNDWEILTEYYRFINRDLSSDRGTLASWASYFQVGRTFGRWTPYARAEKTRLDQTDPYFAQQASGQSYVRAVAGVRYDLDPRAALKLELNRTELTDREPSAFNEVRAQFAIRF